MRSCPSRPTSDRVAGVVPLYAVCLLLALMLIPLWLLWWSSRRRRQPDDRRRPAIDVIIPAYNEEENIARLLRSVDVAAGRYGGPVRVVVSNDGSADRTEQIAVAAVARLRHARGSVLTSPTAASPQRSTAGWRSPGAEYRVRIDADCVMGQDALAYWCCGSATGISAWWAPCSSPAAGHRDVVPPACGPWRRCSSSGLPGWARAWSMASSSFPARSPSSGGRPPPRPGVPHRDERRGHRSHHAVRAAWLPIRHRSGGSGATRTCRGARASSSSSGPAGRGPASTSTPGMSRCAAAWPAAGVVLDDAPGILLVLPAGGRGAPIFMPGILPVLIPATGRTSPPSPWSSRRLRRTARAGQRAVCDQVRALAQPAVGSWLASPMRSFGA